MADDLEEECYERADAHIHLSNEHKTHVSPGRVRASMTYATARFNARISARGFASGEEMARSRDETLAYVMEQYRLMLEEHLDDYSVNFGKYFRE